jgi:hypothetical protein
VGAQQEIETLLCGDDLVATVDAGAGVSLWSVDRSSLIARFDTAWEFGGRRLALCGTSDRPIVVAGAWGRPGVRAHHGQTGQVLWERTDITGSDRIAPAGDGRLAAVCFADGPMQVIDAEDGVTVANVRGLRGFWQSPREAVAVGDTLGFVNLVDTEDWSVRWRAPVSGFATLSAAFGSDRIVVSDTVDSTEVDAMASVYCFDLSGGLRWRNGVPSGRNVGWLGWDIEASEWIGVQHDLEQRVPDALIRWNRDGVLISELSVGRASDYAFLPSGRRLVTANGRVLNTKGATEVAHFPLTAAAG